MIVYLRTAVFALLFTVILCSATSRSSLDRRIRAATDYVQRVLEDPNRGVPRDLLRKAEAVIVLREIKGGLIFGASMGKGIVLVRNSMTGGWSAPGFIESYEGSCGLQFGGSSVESILLVMDKQTIESLSEAKFSMGGDVMVAAGPKGRDAQAKLAPGVAILSYSEAKGLFAGMTLVGGFLERDQAANRQFYGTGVSLNDILFGGEVTVPAGARKLIRLLDDYVAEEEILLPTTDRVY